MRKIKGTRIRWRRRNTRGKQLLIRLRLPTWHFTEVALFNHRYHSPCHTAEGSEAQRSYEPSAHSTQLEQCWDWDSNPSSGNSEARVFFTTTLSCPGRADELNAHHTALWSHGMSQGKQHVKEVLKVMENLRFWNPSSLSWDTLPYPPKSKKKLFPKCMKSHRKIPSPFTDTCLLNAIPLKSTLGTCLITVVSWGNHAKCISSYHCYLRRAKAGWERQDGTGLSHPSSLWHFPGQHVSSQWCWSEKCYSLAPLHHSLEEEERGEEG